MAEKSIIGIDKVEWGACGAAGAMGGVLTEIGLLVPDSVRMTMEEPDKTELYVEGSDAPYITIPKAKRTRQIVLETRGVDPADLVKYFGGSVTLDVWSAPTSEAPIEQSVQLTSVSSGGFYYTVKVPRGLVRASMDAPFSTEETANVKVTIDVLLPLDGGGAPLPPVLIEKVTG